MRYKERGLSKNKLKGQDGVYCADVDYKTDKRTEKSRLKYEGRVFKTKCGVPCKVINYRTAKEIKIQFLDENCYSTTVELGNLRRGNIRNPFFPSVRGVGYLGEGVFKAKINGVFTKEYVVWSSMLARCYSEVFHISNPTYIGCTVCEEWHNFQVFAKWYSEQKYGYKDYVLDKDILFKGNKIYSPKNCRLVPHEINSLVTSSKNSESNLPAGVSFEKKSKKFRASLAVNGKSKYLGVYSTVAEAEHVYKKEKHLYIKESVLKWKGLVDEDIVISLIEKWSYNEQCK